MANLTQVLTVQARAERARIAELERCLGVALALLTPEQKAKYDERTAARLAELPWFKRQPANVQRGVIEGKIKAFMNQHGKIEEYTGQAAAARLDDMARTDPVIAWWIENASTRQYLIFRHGFDKTYNPEVERAEHHRRMSASDMFSTYTQ